MENRFKRNLNKMKSDFKEGKVYKYRSINEFTYHLLINQEMWFSKPKDFNDPFDCNIRVELSNSSSDIKDYYHMYSKEFDFKSNKKWQRLYDSNFENIELGNEIIADLSKKIVSDIGVLSLSKKNDDILMWSHYASSHTGICLEFDIKYDRVLFSPLKNIDYTLKFKNMGYLDNKNDVIENLILCKSDGWAYEEECRVIRATSKAYKFKKKALTAIYFGCKTSDANIVTITSLIKDVYPDQDIQFYKMELDSKSYKLNCSIYK